MMNEKKKAEFLARELMGWTIHEDHNDWADDSCYRSQDGSFENFVSFWHPFQNIEQALGDGGPGTVVGELKKKGWNCKLLNNIWFQDTQKTQWACDLFGEDKSKRISVIANTPATASPCFDRRSIPVTIVSFLPLSPPEALLTANKPGEKVTQLLPNH